MPKFADLFARLDLDYEAKNRVLNEMAEAAGWRVLHAGDSVQLAPCGRSIVITGVVWSKPDLETLDQLAALKLSNAWFFNPDRVPPDQRVLPGAGNLLATPGLAEYDGELLVSFLQGGLAHERVAFVGPAFHGEMKREVMMAYPIAAADGGGSLSLPARLPNRAASEATGVWRRCRIYCGAGFQPARCL